MKKFLFGSFLTFILLGAVFLYYASPSRSILAIRQSFAEENIGQLKRYIDFELVRESLVQQLQKKASDEAENKFLKKLIHGVSGFALDKLADHYITPESILKMATGEDVEKESETKKDEEPKPFEGRNVYDSLRQYSIYVKNEDGLETRFIMRRYDLTWKLEEIILPLE